VDLDELSFAYDQKSSNSLERGILDFIRMKAFEAHPLILVEDKKLLLEINRSWVNTAFPATTNDIAHTFNLPESTAFDLLERFRRSKKIKSRKFRSFKGAKSKLYIPYETSWPEYLFATCGSCENWNRFTRGCTFFRELASKGYAVDKARLNHSITAKLLACKWWLQRTSRALKTYPSLQAYIDEIADLDLWWQFSERDKNYLFSPKNTLPAFRCFKCHAPLPAFGWGYSPLIGNGIVSCQFCGSFNRLIYDEKSDQFTVVVSEEKLDEYYQRYYLYTGGDEPAANYSSSRYGLSLVDFDTDGGLYDELEALTNKNVFAYYNTLKYLVVRSQEEYDLLKQRLEKDYSQIEIILASEPRKSVQPTNQQIGAVRLLRFEGSLTYPFSIELLWSRYNVLKELEEFVNSRWLMGRQEKLLQLLLDVQRLEKTGKQLTVDKWNTTDGRGAKIVWEVIKKIVERYGFELPNRAYARHVEDEHIRPHGVYPSYTDANTIFNANFMKITNVYHEKCNKYDFPWEGLEGFCHKKTSGGVYGFTLDTVEGNKTAIIPTTARAIAEERLVPEMVSSAIMRKRIPIYYLEYGSAANKLLTTECQKFIKEKVVLEVQGVERKVSLEKATEYQVMSSKRLLEDVAWMDEVTISKKGRKIAPWLLAAEERLHELTVEEQARLKKAIKEVLEQASYFKPFRYQREFSEKDFNWKL